MALQQITSADISSLPSGSVSNTQFATGAVESYMNAQGSSFGFRNRIINGAMVIDQRNGGASISGLSGVFAADRWQTYATTTSLSATSQQVSDAPANFTNSLKFAVTSGATSGSSERAQISHVIEGYNIADLGWGTSSAKPITLSFWVKSSKTGQLGGSVQNYDNTRSYPFSYTISNSNTWQFVSITVPGDTTGTWYTNNNGGIQLNFDTGAGSTLLGTANTWAGVNYRGATGDTSIVATTGATFYVTGVQLEKGSTATAFEYRDYTRELQMCQRYYEQFVAGNGSPCYAFSNNTNALASNWQFMVPKRVAPTVTQLSAASRLTTPGISDFSGVWNFSIYGNTQVTNAMFVLNYVSGSQPASGTMAAVSGGLSLSASAEL
jgi:hypothetical protein